MRWSTDRAADKVRLYRGNANGMFDQPQDPLDTGPSPNGVLLADLDRDGRDDPSSPMRRRVADGLPQQRAAADMTRRRPPRGSIR
jgi:hypothetical protein